MSRPAEQRSTLAYLWLILCGAVHSPSSQALTCRRRLARRFGAYNPDLPKGGFLAAPGQSVVDFSSGRRVSPDTLFQCTAGRIWAG